MEPLRILLVDDHVLFRKGLAALLAPRQDMEVMAEAEDGLEAIVRAWETVPDVVLMDIHMPQCDGLEAVRIIKREMPHVHIIMLTVSDDDRDLFAAIKAGAQGYLLKNLEPEDLAGMVRGVFRGEAPISRTTASRILREFGRQARGETITAAVLSPREREILALVAQGLSNRKIAQTLNVTEHTVKNHLRNILDKLHLENRVQAAVFAVRQGLVDNQ